MSKSEPHMACLQCSVSTHRFGLKPEPWLLRSDLVPVQLSLGQPQIPLCGVRRGAALGRGRCQDTSWVSKPSALLLRALQDHSITGWFGLKGL